MFRELWQWWIDGLSAPWPDWLRAGARKCWIRPSGSKYLFSCGDRDARKPVAEMDAGAALPRDVRRRLKSGKVILQLDGEDALIRSFKRPPGAELRIASMLEELSPLPPGQQYFDTIAGDGDTLTLVIAKKSVVDSLKEELDHIGVGIHQVTVSGYEDTPLNLLPSSESGPPADTVGLALVAVGAVVCVAALYLLTQKQVEKLGELTAYESHLQRQLQSGREVRERFDMLQEQVSTITSRKASTTALSLLGSVTSSTPDHTWVRQWVLDGELITLFAETADTADLISRLEASPLLNNVRYESAITHDSTSDRARVRVAAKVDLR